MGHIKRNNALEKRVIVTHKMPQSDVAKDGLNPVFGMIQCLWGRLIHRNINLAMVILLLSSIGLLPVPFVTSVTVSSAGAENVITGLRTGSVLVENQSAARLVVETRNPADVNMFLLTDPYRLVIDFPTLKWRVDGRGLSGALQTPPMRSFRYGAPKPDVSRLVVELSAPAAPVRVFRLPPNEKGHRLVVDVLDRGETAFRLAGKALLNNKDKPLALQVEAPTQTETTMLMPVKRPVITAQKSWPERDSNGLLLPWPRPQQKDTAPSLQVYNAPKNTSKSTSNFAKQDQWIVFIDAGHGGKDPGAIGHSGLYEKDVTLAAAKELARQLNATGRIKAVLSREGDVFHKLRKRIALARNQKADIFISLHADAAHNKKARGVSVFTLSETASDKEAALLASRENKADLIGGPDLGTTDPLVTTALLSMFQRESMNQSSVLAKYITDEFSGLPTPKRGHRFAGFAVLKSPDIPSVLIEMGFLTNKTDEKNLKSSRYRKDLMTRITSAVTRYLDDLPRGPIDG